MQVVEAASVGGHVFGVEVFGEEIGDAVPGVGEPGGEAGKQAPQKR